MFYLWIDIKEDPEEAWAVLSPLLEKYSEILCSVTDGVKKPGPVQVIITGNRPVRSFKAPEGKTFYALLDVRFDDLDDPGIPAWLIGAGVGGVAAAAWSFVALVDAGIISYGASRINMWHDPWLDSSDDGYQMVQSLIAIGSGGLLGTGLGKGRQKFLYLPEESNDFIFSTVCEELGLIGASLILLVFALLLLRGFWIALHARDRFGTLLVVGVMSHLGLQVFLNVAVVTGLVPATGISLPFFSYGGTALLLQLVEIGLVLSVSRQIPAKREG